MYPIAAPNSLSQGALLHFPGLKLWSAGSASEPDRGIYERDFKGFGYKVSGNTLYRFDSLGVQTSVGIIGGSGNVSMKDNGNVLMIVSGGVAYTFDGTALGSLSLSFTPIQVDYLNERFILLDDSENVHLSNVGTTIFGAEIPFQAKSESDETRGIQVFDQYLFVGGQSTFEPFQDIGSGNPSFARINGVIIELTGIANKNCMCDTPSALYFLGDDKIPYRIVSFQARNIAEQNNGIQELFSTYTKETAYLQCCKWQGQNMIFYMFPTEGVVWAYSEEAGLWFQLDHDKDSQMYLGKTFAWVFNKTLVGDRTNGNVYELDLNTYQDNSVVKIRERVFRPMAGETLGAPRAKLKMKCLQLAVNTGVGQSDDNPQMMVSLSTDGGRSFGNEKWIPLGEEGDYQETVETYSNKKFKDLTVKVRYAENTAFSLYDSAIWLREAGK
jgi:hypothetical protein